MRLFLIFIFVVVGLLLWLCLASVLPLWQFIFVDLLGRIIGFKLKRKFGLNLEWSKVFVVELAIVDAGVSEGIGQKVSGGRLAVGSLEACLSVDNDAAIVDMAE